MKVTFNNHMTLGHSIRTKAAFERKGRRPLWILAILLGLFGEDAFAVNFTKVTGEESPGVIIDDESFRCWFSLPDYSVPSGSSTTFSGIGYNGLGQPIRYHAAVSQGGVGQIETDVSGGFYNTVGLVTTFSEVRTYLQSGRSYAIVITQTVYNSLGRVSDFNVTVSLVPTPCPSSLNPSSRSHPPGAGTGTISVFALNGCAWTASPSDGWISIVSGASGTGNGAINYEVTANAGTTSRTGTITVSGANARTFQITQSGNIPAPPNDNFANRTAITGSSATVTGSNVGATKETGEPNHAGNSGGKSVWWTWTAPASGSVTITTASSSFDTLLAVYTGASLATLSSVASNDECPGASRTSCVTFSAGAGTAYQIAVDGWAGAAGSITLNVAQAACTYSISPSNWSAPVAADSTVVSVTAGGGCSWSVNNPCNWVTATPASGTGNGSVTLSVGANPNCSARNCTLTIAGQSFAVSQAAGAGSLTISPVSRSHGPGSETGEVTVSASASDCGWTASGSCGWARITSSASGTGSGTVSYSVDANAMCSPRTCTLTIVGQTFTINQAAGTPSFSISPASHSPGAGAADGCVDVSASGSDCSWTASSDCAWVTITSGASGTGSGRVCYSVQPNLACSSRTCTLTIAGHPFAVTQAVGSGSFSISPANRSHGPTEETDCVDVSATQGCAWLATTDCGWVTITSDANGSGNGRLCYSVTPNPTCSERICTLSIAGQPFTVRQAPGAGTFSILPDRGSYGPGVESGTVSVTASSADCGWTATANAGWLAITSGGSGIGSGRVSYSVAAIPTGNSRTGTLTIAGRTFTVTQAGVLNPFVATKGTYNGLFYETGEVRVDSSGFLTLKVTDKGAFSAKLRLASKSHSFSGRFDPERTASNVVIRSQMPSLAIALALEGDDGIRGTVSDGTWTAHILGDQAQFHTKTSPAPQAGKYTMIIPGDASTSQTPAGDGFATVSVSTAGAASLKGTLADGTKMSQAVALSKNGEWPLFASLYKGKGSMLGWIIFTNLPTEDFKGLLGWTKPSVPKGKYYPDGFAFDSMAVGSRHSATNPVIPLAAGTAEFIGGNLTAPFANDITIGANNKVTNNSPNKLTLKISSSSGLFSGKAVDPDSGKSIPFKGAFLQKRNEGSGFFLGTNQSGRVHIAQ